MNQTWENYEKSNVGPDFGLFCPYLNTNFFLIGIHSMQGWTATTRHGVTRKRSKKILQHAGNLLRQNLQVKDVC